MLQCEESPLDASFTSLTDGELLRLMAERKADPKRAKTAWKVFYNRYIRYLYLGLKRGVFSWISYEAEIKDIAQNTLIRAYRYAGSFRSEPEKRIEGGEEQKSAWKWLGRIAEREFLRTIRGRNKEDTGLYLDGFESSPVIEREERSMFLRFAEEAIEALDERERDILLTTQLYFKIGEEHQRIPNDIAAELKRRWNIKGDNLRQIRHRAMKKFTKYILDRIGEKEAEI